MFVVSGLGSVSGKISQVVSNVGRVDVTLNQIATAQTRTRSGTNIPVGLYFSFNGDIVTVKSGFVTVNNIKYIIKDDLTKAAFTQWSAGDGGGLLLGELPVSFSGYLYIYAIGDGTKSDIAASSSADPTLPTGYTEYTKLGHILLENGTIVEVYPTKDAAGTFIDGDYVTAIKEVNNKVTIIEQEVTEIQRTQYYVHEQGVADTTWEIEHNLHRRPSVTVVDSGDTVVTGLVTYLDDDHLIIQFNNAFKGTAYLN